MCEQALFGPVSGRLISLLAGACCWGVVHHAQHMLRAFDFGYHMRVCISIGASPFARPLSARQKIDPLR